MTGSIPNAQYAFPSISFSESVIGPTPFNPQWRNTIGVAGVFSRGPLGPVKVSSRQDFAYQFGEDDSPGALFLRQAMLQGSTNFVISRVMPSAASASGSVFLQSGTNPTSTEAFVGAGTARTVGLTFEASYIGSPIFNPGTYLGAAVNVDSSNALAIPGYIGTGYFDFRVAEKVLSTTTASTAINANLVTTTNQTDLQVITVTDSTASALISAAKPGLVLRTTASGVTFASASGAQLLIKGYAYQSATSTWSLLVQGQVTGTLTNPIAVTVEAISSNPDYFVLSYLYRSGTGSAALPSTVVASHTYGNGVGSADGFLTIPVTDKAFHPVTLTTSNSGTLAPLVTGIQVAIGDSTDTATTELIPTSQFSIPFIRAQVKVGETNTAATSFPNTPSAFPSGLSSVEVLNQLLIAIDSDLVMTSLFDNIAVNNALLPYSLTFKTNFVGAESNRILYKLTRTVGSGSPTDLQFANTSDLYNTYIPMTGGQDGMQYAQTYLYDANGNPLVLIEAVSPGSIGNSIRLTVTPTPPGGFRLQIEDLGSQNFNVPLQSESFVLSNYSTDVQTGMYPETLDSKLIRAYFVPIVNANGTAISQATYDLTPQRLAPPISSLASTLVGNNPLHPSYKGVAYLKNIYLKGGSEPTNYKLTDPTEQDYLEAVQRLEQVDCAIISLAGVSLTDARYELAVTELLAQAERSSTLNGLRIAVIAAPPRLSETRAANVASGFSSKRAVVVAGYLTLVGARYLGSNSLPAIGAYAGILANISPNVSPAAVTSGQAVTGVLSVDTKNTPTYLDALTRARLEVIYYDPGLQRYKFLNGLTTATDSNDKYVSIRRITDQIIMDLYTNLQWVRSEPNTSSLRSRIASACDAYLKTLQRNESIYAYSRTVCDESNNTNQDFSQGKLNIRLTFTPNYPADFIQVQVVRDLTAEFAISTSTASN